MGVVQQSVEDGVSDRGFADPAVPVLDGQLRGDHSGAPVGAIVDEFEQILAAVGLERLQREIVEDEAVELGEGEQAAFVRAIAARDAQFFEQPRQTSVERAVTEAAGALRECAGEPGLADPGGTDDEHGLAILTASRPRLVRVSRSSRQAWPYLSRALVNRRFRRCVLR